MPGYESTHAKALWGSLSVKGSIENQPLLFLVTSIEKCFCNCLVGFKRLIKYPNEVCGTDSHSLGSVKGEHGAGAVSGTRRQRASRSSLYLPKRDLPPQGQCCGEKTQNKQPHQTTMWRRGSCRCKLFCFQLCVGHYDLVFLETPKTQKLALYRAPRD